MSGAVEAVSGILTLLDLLLRGAVTLEKFKEIVAPARAEGRDVTIEEVGKAVAIYAETDKQLLADIARARGEGR